MISVFRAKFMPSALKCLPRPKLFVVTGRIKGQLQSLPIMSFSRDMAAITTKELWPHMNIVTVAESCEWED
jgi:hypothetical protein